MSNYILEGESFFILKELENILYNKKYTINPDLPVQTFSLLRNNDFDVFFDPDKNKIELLKDNFILCFMDKNIDQRSDYIKRVKNISILKTLEPIPTTDFASLQKIFNKFTSSNYFPSKKTPLKYKGQKQNYEWYDLCLIDDLYGFGDQRIYQAVCDSYFDIWKFTDQLWSIDPLCVEQLKYINGQNFEDYFNRIRETSKDYLEVIQSGANNFQDHKKILPNSIVNNDFRFNKVKSKINNIRKEFQMAAIGSFDECLKNVRMGSNPKLELINIFIKFKEYAR